MSQNSTALVLTIVSLSVAGISLAWNIYREVWLKARMKVVVDTLVEVPVGADGRVLAAPTGKLGLSAINLGPREIKCEVAIATFGSAWDTVMRRRSRAVLARLDQKKLEVGERVQFTLAWENAFFLAEPHLKIGVVDSFGRTHWASRSQVRRRVHEYREKTAAETA